MRTLVDAVLAGNERAAGRLLRGIDDDAPGAFDAIEALHAHTGNAFILGITGNPGSGKSTLVNALVAELRRHDHTVGVIAIDPTSPFTGGAILGDRVRIAEHALDPGVYIRSVATRGNLGGISRSTPALLAVMDAMGFDWIIVETVGVGQDEVDIAAFCDTCVVVAVPGLGDTIQASKAGILEVADIFVVNKADRPGADTITRELTQMISLDTRQDSKPPPVLPTVATRGDGVDALHAAIQTHRDSGHDVAQRRKRRRRMLARMIAIGEAARRIDALLDGPVWADIESRMQSGEISPFAAARLLAASGRSDEES